MKMRVNHEYRYAVPYSVREAFSLDPADGRDGEDACLCRARQTGRSHKAWAFHPLV